MAIACWTWWPFACRLVLNDETSGNACDPDTTIFIEKLRMDLTWLMAEGRVIMAASLNKDNEDALFTIMTREQAESEKPPMR